MKLNNPIQVRDSLNEQKRIDIDLGIKLANRVDNVRKNLNEEEMKYQKFHDETIKLIQNDIDNKILEKDQLLITIKDLEIKRSKLLEPISREWDNLNKQKEKINLEKEELGKTSRNLVDIIQRNESRTEWNKMETRRIANIEAEFILLRKKAKEEKLEARDILQKAKQKASSLVEPLLEREKCVLEKQKQLEVYLATLKDQSEEIKAKYEEIEEEKKRLSDQRGIIERQIKRI